jgi:hypothetical protein
MPAPTSSPPRRCHVARFSTSSERPGTEGAGTGHAACTPGRWNRMEDIPGRGRPSRSPAGAARTRRSQPPLDDDRARLARADRGERAPRCSPSIVAPDEAGASRQLPSHRSPVASDRPPRRRAPRCGVPYGLPAAPAGQSAGPTSLRSRCPNCCSSGPPTSRRSVSGAPGSLHLPSRRSGPVRARRRRAQGSRGSEVQHLLGRREAVLDVHAVDVADLVPEPAIERVLGDRHVLEGSLDVVGFPVISGFWAPKAREHQNQSVSHRHR